MRQQKYVNRLKSIREDINVKRYNEDKPLITQAMLARFSGVRRETIVAIENHEQMPSYPTAIKIAYLLRDYCKITDLFPVPPLKRTPDKSA